MTTKKNEIALNAQKNITEAVLGRVHALQASGGLTIPEDYSPENALNAAYLKLKATKDKHGNAAEKVCTPASVSMALLDMVIQGLTPARGQCYFVVYGDELTLMRSYLGAVAVAKRFAGVKDVFAQVVYKGDAFEYKIDPATGIKKVTKHTQTLDSVDEGTIVAAYATVTRDDAEPYQEIMTWKEIQTAWNQGQTKGSSPAHKNFTQEMAKKTVINRACKIFINSASDRAVLAEAYNRTVENDYKQEPVQAEVIEEGALEAIFGPQSDEAPEKDQEPEKEEKSAEAADFELTEEEKAAIIAQEEAEAQNEIDA